MPRPAPPTDTVRVAPDHIFDFACALDRPDAHAGLLSCGALRSVEVIDRLEQQLGKLVICSNTAMLWEVLRLAGRGDRLPDLDRLLRDQ